MLPTHVQSSLFVVVTVATGLKAKGYAANTERVQQPGPTTHTALSLTQVPQHADCTSSFQRSMFDLNVCHPCKYVLFWDQKQHVVPIKPGGFKRTSHVAACKGQCTGIVRGVCCTLVVGAPSVSSHSLMLPMMRSLSSEVYMPGTFPLFSRLFISSRKLSLRIWLSVSRNTAGLPSTPATWYSFCSKATPHVSVKGSKE